MWYSPPLVSLTFFYTGNFLKHRRVPLRSFSVLRDNKFSIENRDMPSFIHKLFSVPKKFRKTERFLYKDFRLGPVRQKNSTKPRCPASNAWKLSIKKISEKPKCSPMKKFGTVRQKLRRNIAILAPPLIQNFLIPEISETLKGSGTNFFGTVTQKKFDRKTKS